MDDILGVFGAAIADFNRFRRNRETRNFQQGSLAGQKKILDAQNKSIDIQKQIASWGRIQSGTLTKMSSTLERIEAEMLAARQLQTETLAIQKELLARDNLQAFLEEFIYQAQKLVAECSSDQSQLPVSTRYFLLQGLLVYIKNSGVETSMIRGRENKFAFDSAISQADGARKLLAEFDEVKEALAWQKNEKKLLAESNAVEQAKQAKIARTRMVIAAGIVVGVPTLLALGCAGLCFFGMAFGGRKKKDP